MDFDKAEWARAGASEVLEQEDRACFETADYRICGFVLAAAKVALEDAGFARRIGELMEPPRKKSHLDERYSSTTVKP